MMEPVIEVLFRVLVPSSSFTRLGEWKKKPDIGREITIFRKKKKQKQKQNVSELLCNCFCAGVLFTYDNFMRHKTRFIFPVLP